MNNRSDIIGNTYRIFDLITLPAIQFFVDTNRIERTICFELGKKKEFDTNLNSNSFEDEMEFIQHMDSIHSRISTLISHISIMIGVLLFSLSRYSNEIIPSSIILVELVIYLLTMIVCLRCMRSYGFEESFSDRRKYNNDSIKELVYRFAAYRLVNFLVIVITLIFVLLLILKPPF